MNLSKSYEYFKPEMVNGKIHIIGCGAIGSTIAFYLAKLGCTDIVLWDDDVVESKNVNNQMFRHQDIGKRKTEALKAIMEEINPEIKIQEKGFYTNQQLKGYIFMAVDSIKIRNDIVDNNMYNLNIDSVFDFRMRLTDAQSYAAVWSEIKDKERLKSSMDFTDDEAEEQTPRSACHETLSFMPTITGICGLGIENFVKYINTGELKRVIMFNLDTMSIDAFK